MSWVLRRQNANRPTKYSNNLRVFTIELHHGGIFDWNDENKYVGGTYNLFDNCTPKEMSYMSIIEMAAKVGCNGVKKLWYKRVDSSFSSDLLELLFDKDAVGLMGFVNEIRIVEVYCDCVGVTFPHEYSDSEDDDDDYNCDEDASDEKSLHDSENEDVGLEDEEITKAAKAAKDIDNVSQPNASQPNSSQPSSSQPKGSQAKSTKNVTYLQPQNEDALDVGYVSSDGGFNSECDSMRKMG